MADIEIDITSAQQEQPDIDVHPIYGLKGAQGERGLTGNGISSITLASSVGLVDTYNVNYTDGNKTSFTVTNGEKGEQGEQGIQGIQGETGIQGIQGETGATPNITVNASVNNTVGTPSVNVVKTGTDENPIFSLAFQNLKGETGSIDNVTFGDITGQVTDNIALTNAFNSKQDTLISGINIKTINNNSILGSGDLALDGLPSQTGHAGQFLTTDGTEPSWASAPFRNIGEIFFSTIPVTDAGAHLLDGSQIVGGGIYNDFVESIANLYGDGTNIPNYFCTESEWQTSVTNYGVCGKFVYDSVNNTVRLPKYNSKIYTGGGTAPVIGNGMTLGLTNGTNNYGLSGWSGDTYTQVIPNIYGQPVGISGSGSANRSLSLGVTSDPTKSGIIAQLSDITTSLDGYYYIVIATSTKTDIQVDIDEIATDLNEKADVDLTNCTKPHIVETYQNGTSWYRVYSDGWCEQGGLFPVTSSWNTNTITFLKPFRDNNYNILYSNGFRNQSSIYGIASKSPTQATITIYNGSSDGQGGWQASGYIN